MSKLVWDAVGERLYETGTKHGVLYPQVGNAYPKGYVWNGLTAVTESPDGGDATAIYADDIKYLNIRAVEDYGATIEAYTYPDEFADCDGSRVVATGVTIGQQPRKPFGFSWTTTIGNDTQYDEYGEKLHLVWGATASPSEKSYQTINDSPEAITFSWEIDTVPVDVPGYKPTSHMEIDTTKISAEALTALKDVLYGTNSTDARLPLPDEVIDIITGHSATYVYTAVEPVGTENPVTEGWYIRLGNDFILSTDTSVVTGTTYYERTEST